MFLLFQREPYLCRCLKVDGRLSTRRGVELIGFSILCHYFIKKLSSCFPYPLLRFQSETNFPFIFLFACFILMTVKKPVCQCTAELLLAHELNQFTLNLFRRHFNTNQGIVVSTCVSAHELVYCFRCLWNF